jgi:hypothetical protein
VIYHAVDFGLWSGFGFGVLRLFGMQLDASLLTQRVMFLKNFFRYPNDLSMLTPPLLKKLNQSVATGNTHDSLRVTGVIRLFASRGDRRDRLSRDETNW